MKRIKLAFPIIALALLAMAPAASAQIRTGTVEIDPFYGRLFGGQFASGSNSLFEQTVDVDDANTYGVRLGFNSSEVTQFEIQASRTDTHFVSANSGGVFGPGGQRLGDLRIDYLLGYGTFNFGHRRAVPYFTIGGGVARLQPSNTGVPAASSTRFTGSLGVGMKFYFNPHFGLRVDGRGYATYLNSSDTCGDFGNCDNSHYLTNGEVSGGLIFAF